MILYSKVTGAPSEFPVTLSEAKLKLKVTGDEEDNVISNLIKTATQICESDSGLSFITQSRTVTLDKFPCGTIILPYGPVTSVTSFTYIDEDGNQKTLTVDDDFILDKHNVPARLQAVDSWPSTKERINAITIVYGAGYGLAVDVPQCAKDSILSLVATMFEHRQDEEAGTLNLITWNARRMLDPIRVDWYAKV